MLDLRDSVQKGRELDTKDESGATAVSPFEISLSFYSVKFRFMVCLYWWH